MRKLYIYVKKEKYEDYLKYGIKLSQFSDIIVNLDTGLKNGIKAYLTPKDSELYNDASYCCLKITPDNLKIFVLDTSLRDSSLKKKHICKLSEYEYGSYELPIAVIFSSILPEGISLYNKIIDSPLLIDNSKEYFYNKSVNTFLENGYFSNRELYKAMLLLGQQKGIFEKISDDNNAKIFLDKKSKKTYTDITKFQ